MFFKTLNWEGKMLRGISRELEGEIKDRSYFIVCMDEIVRIKKILIK